MLRKRSLRTRSTTRNSNRFPTSRYESTMISEPCSQKSSIGRHWRSSSRCIILFLGGLAINTLPISQFPDVAPPTVMVSVSYPGASANVLVDSVLIILEQSINGVQDMRYMISDATSAGEATIQIYLRAGHGPEHGGRERAKPGQHREEPAPAHRGAGGHHRQQVMPSMLMYVNIYSTDPNVDQNFLYNYANVNIMPEIKRIQGIGMPRNPRQPLLRHAGLAESRPHARLQRVRRGRHEGRWRNRA